MLTFKRNFPLIIAAQVLTCTCLFGEIKNGYSPDIHNIYESLQSLNRMLSEDKNLSMVQRTQIKNKIGVLMQHIVYYELTGELIEQLKSIAPGLYDEIDNIKGVNGKPVDVYVRFVPEKEMQLGAAATTNLACIENDKNSYQSEYGPNTVSVKIASMPKALLLLAHEFGHVKYQVANLGSYLDYYAVNYQNGTFNSSFIGHNTSDPSGKMAAEYESILRRDYLIFLKTKGKVDKPIVLLERIQKTVDREAIL